MNTSIKKVAGGFWFKLATVNHPNPAKLPKGSLSYCLTPIQLPEDCRVLNGLPAQLAIARAVGDDENIEWMAVESEWKQALCVAIMQSGVPPFNQWFHLVDYGTTMKPRSALIDELRQAVQVNHNFLPPLS